MSYTNVSIQLISPASGDLLHKSSIMSGIFEFPFNLFPQRVGTFIALYALEAWEMFPFNLFPQRVGTDAFLDVLEIEDIEFPFNLFPQRVGTQVNIMATVLTDLAFPFNLFPQRVGTSITADHDPW